MRQQNMTNRIPRFDNTALLNWAILPSKDYEQSLSAIALATAETKSYFTKRTQNTLVSGLFCQNEPKSNPFFTSVALCRRSAIVSATADAALWQKLQNKANFA
jgi:hypothetical protein